MKILLTGTAGFIGSHTAHALLDQGHSIIGIDDFNDYYDIRQKEKNVAHLCSSSQFTLIRGDICDSALLESIFTDHKFNAICHLAARAGVRASIESPELYIHTNIHGTNLIFEKARKHAVKKIVYASSSSVYGNNTIIPFNEDHDVSHPVSPYAMTKRATELLAYTYHYLYGLSCIGLRFFTVYGPSGRPDMAPYIFTDAIHRGLPIKKFGDGNTKRDYTFISDIVSGICSALEADLGYEIINLGNNTPVSLNTFIEIIEQVCNKKANIIPYPMQAGDVEVTYADISKANRLLNYTPKISLEEGIARFYTWYKQGRRI